MTLLGEYTFVVHKTLLLKVKNVDEGVNMLYGIVRRAGRDFENKTAQFKEWDYWYDEPFEGKKREVKVALKEYKQRKDEESRSR
jgi:hypothetical protein